MAAAIPVSPEPEADIAARPDDPGAVILQWRSHPIKSGGRRLWIVAGALIVLPVGLFFLYGPFYCLLAVIILGGSLAAYFLPTDYFFYTGGLESVFLGVHRRFTWSQFRSYYRDRHGVLLSPFPQPARLENFRGIYLRFDGQTEKVMAIVADQINTVTSAADAHTGRNP